MQVEELLEIIQEVFSEMRASAFCGCYEGDLVDRYPAGVEQFKEKFIQKVSAHKG